jgi:ribA/ribD-fused uncharacterized protein
MNTNEDVIDRFEGKYAFLDNGYNERVRWQGTLYRTAEHAFQSAKFIHNAYKSEINRAPTAEQARHIAKRHTSKDTVRPDLEQHQYSLMLSILRAKFSDKTMRRLLLGTGSQQLVWVNKHSDEHWGCVEDLTEFSGYRGQNHLGRLLMQVRDECRELQQGENNGKNTTQSASGIGDQEEGVREDHGQP